MAELAGAKLEPAAGSAPRPAGSSPRPKTAVRPVRLHFYDGELRTTVRRTVGYRAACSCRWTGPVRRRRPFAVVDRLEHDAEHRAA